jgi:Cu/Ag efflux protein CusF
MAFSLQLVVGQEESMKRILIALAITVWSAPLFAQQAEQPTAPPSRKISQLENVTGEVQKVDLKRREVTLKEPNGNVFTVEVPESVKRLNEIKKGDQVQLHYYQSIAVRLLPPGAKAPQGEETYSQRSQGQMPAGTIGRQINATATVAKTDPANNQVTLRLANGEVHTLNVENPQYQEQLRTLHPGDQIQVTYTEAVAASVTRQP